MHKILAIGKKLRSKKFEGSNRVVAKLTLLLSRICYCTFWIIDNIKILVIVGLIRGNPRSYGKASFFVWFLGLISSLLHNTLMLRVSYGNEAELKNTIINNKTPKQVIQILQDSSRERFKIMLSITRNCGDLLIAIQQIGLVRKLLFTNINYGVIACGGFVSSQIGLYQLYNKILKQEKPQPTMKYH